MKKEELFSKALKFKEVEIKSELLVSEEELCDKVCEALQFEFGVSLCFEEFRMIVQREVEERKVSLRYFRNDKNEPITNMFKKIIRNFCRERNFNLNNDVLSRLLNLVRQQYGSDAVLSAGMFPARAFFERRRFGIPDDLGDTNSCFRKNGCNEGNAIWLDEIEDRVYDRAKLLVFYYQSGAGEGFGRCWFYKVTPGAVFLTNFYSTGFDIKAKWLTRYIIRVARLLAELPEGVKYSYKSISLPIYLNRDGIIIYDPSQHNNSEDVIERARDLISQCLKCRKEIEVRYLTKYDDSCTYKGVDVEGLIVCDYCYDRITDQEVCVGCREYYLREDMYFVDGEGFFCEECFNDNFFYCDRCDIITRVEQRIVTRDGEWLCESCAYEIGAVCDSCGEFFYYDDDEVEIDEYDIVLEHWTKRIYLCDRCAKRDLKKYQCQQCGRTHYFLTSDFMINSRIRDMVRLELCLDCYSKKLREAYEFAFENKEHPSLFNNTIDTILAMP
jgi:hypothetical protein